MKGQKYLEKKKIGKGAFGDVYEAINEETSEKVAIKKINKQKMRKGVKDYDYYVTSLKREIDSMKKCKCENTVELYDFYEDDENFVMVMELCDTSLSDNFKVRKKAYTANEIYEIFSDLNNTFKIMHKNKIVHRDLKLENVLIKYTNKEKTKFISKLCDFGFSKQIEEVSVNTLLGTAYTVAPEVVFKGKYDSKADLWSIGVMMYFCAFNECLYKDVQGLRQFIKEKPKFKKPTNIFLADLLSKLLVVDLNERISWEEYFNHPFFKLNSLTEINFGFKSRYLKYYKAQYKEDEKNFKTVLVKEMKQNNLGQDFYYFDYRMHNKFNNNKNALKLNPIVEFKDDKDKQIIYFIYDYDDKYIPLSQYIKYNNLEEKDIHKFINDFYNIFKKGDEFDKNIFISIFSFVINQEDKKIKLIDFGLTKLFLSEEQMQIYYAPNEDEMANSVCPSKTRLMNFGITLLKIINNNDDNVFYEGKEFTLKYKQKISDNLNNLLTKILCPDIKNRPDWEDLDLGNEPLLNENQFEIFMDNLLTKYKTINEYYDSINIGNIKYISENEDFILLTIYEINTLKKMLSDEKEFKKGKYEITLLTILNQDANKLDSELFNLNSKKCLDSNLIKNSLCPEKKSNFIDEISKINENLTKLALELKKKTNSEKFSIVDNNVEDDFFENFMKKLRNSEFHKFFFSFIHKFLNSIEKKQDIDYNKASLEIKFWKYIGEYILFFKEGVKTSNDFNVKSYDSKDDLLEVINKIFSKSEKGENYILISLFCEKIRSNFDILDNEQNQLEQDNKEAIEQLIQFYPSIIKLINYVGKKNN